MISSKKLSKLFNKIGFFHTFEILSIEEPMKLRIFFEKLAKIGGYYNAFYRIKQELFKHKLIEIYNENGARMIKLTPKGIEFKANLESLISYVRQ